MDKVHVTQNVCLQFSFEICFASCVREVHRNANRLTASKQCGSEQTASPQFVTAPTAQPEHNFVTHLAAGTTSVSVSVAPVEHINDVTPSSLVEVY
jgi:hypothetical protein